MEQGVIINPPASEVESSSKDRYCMAGFNAILLTKPLRFAYRHSIHH
jgi:hypothetical protein